MDVLWRIRTSVFPCGLAQDYAFAVGPSFVGLGLQRVKVTHIRLECSTNLNDFVLVKTLHLALAKPRYLFEARTQRDTCKLRLREGLHVRVDVLRRPLGLPRAQLVQFVLGFLPGLPYIFACRKGLAHTTHQALVLVQHESQDVSLVVRETRRSLRSALFRLGERRKARRHTA